MLQANLICAGAKLISLHNSKFMSIFRLGDGEENNQKPPTTAEDLLGEGKIKNIAQVGRGLKQILKNILGPILMVIGVAAIIYAIYLGVMYAKAEDAEKRKSVQGRLIGACIGAVIILVGATLCFALQWDAIFHNFSITEHKFVDLNKDGICDSCKK